MNTLTTPDLNLLPCNDLTKLGVDEDQQKARENAKRILGRFKKINLGGKSANTMLHGLTGLPVVKLGNLRHGVGTNNFNLCLFCPEVVNDQTVLWVLENQDTKDKVPRLKFIGGGSWPGENVIEAAIREMNEELGKFAMNFYLLTDPKLVSSKEDKLGEFYDVERGWNHFRIPLIADGLMGFSIKKHSKDKENTVPRQMYFKDLLEHPNLNRAHKENLKEFVRYIAFNNPKLGQKFKDVVTYYFENNKMI